MPNLSNSMFNQYAIVDLGSNSFHMIIARKTDNSVQIIYKNKQTLHLASGLNEDNTLNKASFDKAIACLALFAERLKDFPIENVKVIATHTLRIAKNRYQFLIEAAKVFPYPIEIISGQEEARLIYLGAIVTESNKKNETKLIIDIGGGSTEIASGINNQPAIVESRPMGCVTYTKQFFTSNLITKAAFNQARFAAEQQVEKISSIIKKQHIDIAFGSSGTVKAIYNILLDLGVSDGVITPKRLDDLIRYTLECQSFEEIDYPSLSDDRKQVFVARLAIFSGIFKSFNLTELHYSESALREGVLHEMCGDAKQNNIKQNTVISLAKQYNIDEDYASQVIKTAQYLLTKWKSSALIEVDLILESLLYWAALLHEIGLNINFSGIQKHSAYILEHANMPGFNEEQQLLLSTLVRYHRKNFKINHLPSFSLFEKKQIYPLIQILRLAVLIHNQRQTELDLSVFNLNVNPFHPNQVELTIAQHFAQKNRLILLDLEQEQQIWANIKDWQLSVNIE